VLQSKEGISRPLIVPLALLAVLLDNFLVPLLPELAGGGDGVETVERGRVTQSLFGYVESGLLPVTKCHVCHDAFLPDSSEAECISFNTLSTLTSTN
jgi:hypothetical protein